MSDDEDFTGFLSDEGGALSSSEEEQELRQELDNFIEKSSRKAKKKDEDFEDEMRSELDKRFSEYQTVEGPAIDKDAEGSTITGPDGKKFYSEMYYDSDSDGEEDKKKDEFSEKRRVLTNDELLYDPVMDDEDQKWVDRQRKKYQPKASKKGTTKKLANSDAVLNCPACFTLLCLDCQRHDIYQTQYRAMFALNCSVDESQVLHMQPKEAGRAKGKKAKKKGVESTNPEKSETQTADEEMPPEIGGQFSQNGYVMARNAGATFSDGTDSYHPVKCNECGTEVAVYDTDEVYHFFNVITSF